MSTDWAGAINLGVDRGTWRPRTWDDIVEAAAGGLLDESRWVDLKRELKPGKPGNIDLAVDIAAMSLEGGLLIYGITDHDSRAGNVVGIELVAKIADRVDQVARMKVHPPAQVRSVEIADPNRPGWGCLLVIVPPSPQAPHMVDHVYYGRGDRANHKLSDQDVRQALAVRDQRQHNLSEQLQALRAEDPHPAPHQQGHLYVIAQPLAAPDDAMVEALTKPDIQNVVLLQAHEIAQRLGTHWSPTLADLDKMQRRADGLAFLSYYDPNRMPETLLLELMLREDGTVALTCGRATDTLRRPALEEFRVLFPALVLGLTHSVLSMAAHLAENVSGYQGQWAVGVLLDNLKGVGPYNGPYGMRHHVVTYSREEYEHLTTTTTAELVEHADAVVDRLLGRLMRGLGVDRVYLPYSVESLTKGPQ